MHDSEFYLVLGAGGALGIGTCVVFLLVAYVVDKLDRTARPTTTDKKVVK